MKYMVLTAAIIVCASSIHQAKASADIYLCNDGDETIQIVKIDSKENKISGWYTVKANRCSFTGSGGSVDITVGIFPEYSGDPATGYTKYYDLDPPKMYKPGLMWIPDNEISIEKTNRRVCADVGEFETSVLTSCPSGWIKIPMIWRIWSYPSGDKYYNIHFIPSDDDIKQSPVK